MIKGILKLAGLLLLAVGALFAVPTIASANPTGHPSQGGPCSDQSRTVTVHLASRPDSGNHGDWATDTITRVVTVKHDAAQADLVQGDTHSWHYTATVADTGTFVTVPGAANSPNAGASVVHATGTVKGLFHATFVADACWYGWIGGQWDGKTLTGAAGTPANPATSAFVPALWKHGIKSGNAIDNDWTWTYATCSQAWTDDYKNDGHGAKDGDITGKACPSPSPSPTPTMTASPTKGGAVPTPTTSTSAGGALPVTGAKEDVMAGSGVVLLLVGAGGVLWGRRNRTRFEA